MWCWNHFAIDHAINDYYGIGVVSSLWSSLLYIGVLLAVVWQEGAIGKDEINFVISLFKSKNTFVFLQDYERILEDQLSGIEYSHHKAAQLSKSVSDAIKARSKLAHSSRYKIIVYVTIVERSHTDAIQACRCVWNTDTDLSYTMEYKNQSIYASVSIFAVYNE